MNKLITSLVVASAIALSGCFGFASTPPPEIKIVTQLVPVVPPKKLYDCYQRKLAIPAGKLTDAQAGQVVVDMKSIIDECQSDARGVDKYVTRTEANLNKKR